jgi:hypothetical protein
MDDAAIRARRDAIDAAAAVCGDRLDSIGRLHDLGRHRDALLLAGPLALDLGRLAAGLDADAALTADLCALERLGRADSSRLAPSALAQASGEARRTARDLYRTLAARLDRRRHTFDTTGDRWRRAGRRAALAVLVIGLAAGLTRLYRTLQPPAYAWGEVLSLTAADAAGSRRVLGPGWGQAETGFTWTLGASAVIRFKAPPPDRDLELVAEASPYVAGSLTGQTVELEINGQPLGRARLEAPGTLRFAVPRALAAASPVVNVRFSLPDARSPYTLGLGYDSRIYGIAVRSVSLRPVLAP